MSAAAAADVHAAPVVAADFDVDAGGLTVGHLVRVCRRRTYFPALIMFYFARCSA